MSSEGSPVATPPSDTLNTIPVPDEDDVSFVSRDTVTTPTCLGI